MLGAVGVGDALFAAAAGGAGDDLAVAVIAAAAASVLANIQSLPAVVLVRPSRQPGLQLLLDALHIGAEQPVHQLRYCSCKASGVQGASCPCCCVAVLVSVLLLLLLLLVLVFCDNLKGFSQTIRQRQSHLEAYNGCSLQTFYGPGCQRHEVVGQRTPVRCLTGRLVSVEQRACTFAVSTRFSHNLLPQLVSMQLATRDQAT